MTHRSPLRDLARDVLELARQHPRWSQVHEIFHVLEDHLAARARVEETIFARTSWGTPLHDSVMTIFARTSGHVRTRDVIRLMPGQDKKTVHNVLGYLARRGRIENVGRGLWRLPVGPDEGRPHGAPTTGED